MKSWFRPPARVKVRPQDKDNDSDTRLRMFFETLIKINKRTRLLKFEDLERTYSDHPRHPVANSYERLENESNINDCAKSGKSND